MEKPVRNFEEVAEAVGRAQARIPRLEVRDLGPLNTSWGIYPFYLLHLEPAPSAPGPPLTVYLSGGIHGDEPAGVWAILEFLKRFNQLDGPYPHTRFTILPCLNPSGFERNTRHNADDLDLNRQFRLNTPPPEVEFVKKAVGGSAFDLIMEFHEDVDTRGFYLYELTQDGERSWGREIINRISRNYPVNQSDIIEETPADNGLIHPNGEHDDFHHFIRSRQEWPQAFFHFSNGGSYCYTTETPITLTRAERVDIHLTALDVALRELWKERCGRVR